jgi:hypothetical protein
MENGRESPVADYLRNMLRGVRSVRNDLLFPIETCDSIIEDAIASQKSDHELNLLAYKLRYLEMSEIFLHFPE